MVVRVVCFLNFPPTCAFKMDFNIITTGENSKRGRSRCSDGYATSSERDSCKDSEGFKHWGNFSEQNMYLYGHANFYNLLDMCIILLDKYII